MFVVNSAALLLLTGGSLIATADRTPRLRPRRRDFICCENDTCGGDLGAELNNQCRGRSNDPDFDCAWLDSRRPHLCETIICCMEEDCGGDCVEDRFAEGQCKAKMRQYGYVCEEQPFQCCDDTCMNCKGAIGNVLFGQITDADCASNGPNRRTACETTFCCKNDDCTACSFTGNTPENCEPAGGTICTYGGADGDPHVETWNHKWFDFHGVCDLVMLDAPDFDGIGLKVHVRTTGRYEYSFISHAVVKLGNDTLEVQSFGDYAINDVSSAEMPNLMAGFIVTHTQVNKKRNEFRIDLHHGEKIVISTFKDIVSVHFDSASSKDFHGAVGLMGEFGTGKMLARDGKTIIQDPVAFGKEWQVQETEEKLFQTDRHPQHPVQCVLPSEEQKESRRRRLGETKSRQSAEEACAWWGPKAMERCIFDVLVSGDIELAEAGPN